MYYNYDLMPAIALLVEESLSSLIKVVTTPRNIEFIVQEAPDMLKH